MDPAIDSGERHQKREEHHEGHRPLLIARMKPQDEGSGGGKGDSGMPAWEASIKKRLIRRHEGSRQVPRSEPSGKMLEDLGEQS